MAAAVLLLLLVSACGLRGPSLPGLPGSASKPGQGGGVTEAMVGSVGHLNPLFETEANDRDLDALIYQGLVT
ncbi:MAG: hypothetical protein ACRENM_02275, partial [Candidatus Dormibacteraceae bacterium]